MVAQIGRWMKWTVVSAVLSITLGGCSSQPQGDAQVEESAGALSQALTAPAWAPNKAYTANTLVSYAGKVYRCRQAHTSLVGWEPPNVAALWSYEGDVTTTTPDPTPPASSITFDYVTLDADCDANPASCCQVGSIKKELTAADDTYFSVTPKECVLALQGRDTVFLRSSGPSSLLLGVGDDTAMDGASDDIIWGGPGNDTINGWGGTNLFFGGPGNDTITGANGTNVVVPGPGIDTVSLGTGDDTAHIFDLCETGAGERIDGGTGFDTLYTPVPLATLQQMGVIISNFERIIVQAQPCRSQCTNHNGCGPCKTDTDKDGVNDCQDGCPVDPKKTAPGLCNCGEPDTDLDGDTVPGCFDRCEKDAQSSRPGTCGCPSARGPNGTPCADGICSGTFSCNNGVCGNPEQCSPDPGHCTPRELNGRVYWLCKGTGGVHTYDDARARCESEPGQSLARIDSAAENAFFAALLGNQQAWIGASDAAVEGAWRWTKAAPGSTNTLFWQNDARVGLSYANWAGGKPGNVASADCALLDGATGLWTEAPCSGSFAYVCEKLGPTVRQDTTPTKDVTCGDFFPGTSCQPEPKEAPDCVDPSEALGQNGVELTPAEFEARVVDCKNRCPTGAETACAEACVGPAAIPGPDSRCGGFSSDELHKCVLENVDLNKDCTKDSDCTGANQICAMYYPCSACDVRDPVTDKCIGNCPGVPRCGVPNRDCARSAGFHERCGDVEVCTPQVELSGDPLGNPATNLSETPVTPTSLFGTPATPPVKEVFPPDPACQGSTCGTLQGKAHPWCNFGAVAPLGDKGAGDAGSADDKKASAGSDSLLQFDIDPNLALDFKASPKAFGELDLHLKAEASFNAKARISIIGGVATIDIIDALAGVYAERCRAWADLRFEVFGQDILSAVFEDDTLSKLKFDSNPSVVSKDACEKAVKDLERAANAAKKAMRDAQELVRQYNTAIEQNKRFDPKPFCDALLVDPPLGFPAGDCTTDSPEQTINRFIRYYETAVYGDWSGDIRTAVGLSDYLNGMKQFQLHVPRSDAPVLNIDEIERFKIAQAQFFLGPVPMTMQLESFISYGLQGNLGARITPTLPTDGNPTELAYVGADVTPHASAGINLFVGAGFSAGPFEASVGVSGEIILGQINLPVLAGAGIWGTATDDPRVLSDADAKLTDGWLFPRTGSKNYAFQLHYDYGARIRLDKFLAGSLAGEVRVQFLFFSKRWRQVLVKFNGIPSDGTPLIDRQLFGDSGNAALGDFDWGFAKMPLPFVKLKSLPVPGPMSNTALTKTAVNLIPIEELFYESLCECKLTGQGCGRADDCCGGGKEGSAICFAEPTTSGGLNGTLPSVCAACRTSGQTCSAATDCCKGQGLTCEQGKCAGKPDEPPVVVVK